MSTMTTSTQQSTVRSTTQADVRFTVTPTNPWGWMNQPVRRTYGEPGAPGDGARSAVRDYADTLRELADN